MKQRLSQKHQSLIWQLPLTLIFLFFGLMITAQYQTHQNQSSALESQSEANLAILIKDANDRKSLLENDLSLLQTELEELEAMVAGGQSIAASIQTRINNINTAFGLKPISGPGISLTITGESNLMYIDIIDIVNELFVSGAEAVSINGMRFTSHTLISEEARLAEEFDPVTQKTVSSEQYVTLVNGKELLYPIIIQAVGNAQALETGLTMSGGIISVLNSLYRVFPVIKQMQDLHIPAAPIYEYEYASQPAAS